VVKKVKKSGGPHNSAGIKRQTWGRFAEVGDGESVN